MLDINTVINVAIATAQAGVNAFNPNNIVIFTEEQPETAFTLGYKIYTNPTDVVNDFGTISESGEMASSIFMQKPNILNGNGRLIIIPLEESVSIPATSGKLTTANLSENLVAFKAVTAGAFKIALSGAGAVQTALMNFSLCSSVSAIASIIQAGLGATHGKLTTVDLSASIDAFEAVSTGAFKLALNGGAGANITGLDFSECENVQSIVDVIQAKFTSLGTACTCTKSGDLIVFTSTATGATSAVAITSPDSGTNIIGATLLNISAATAVAGSAAKACTVTASGNTLIFTDAATGAASEVEITAPTSGTDITVSGLLNIAAAVAVQGEASYSGAEKVYDAIVRTQNDVNYCGIMVQGDSQTDDMMYAAGYYVQSLGNKIMFMVKQVGSALTAGGLLYRIKAASLSACRGLYYDEDTGDSVDAQNFMAAYASCGMSVDFDSKDTTKTMHLKTLVGIVADDTIDSTVLTALEAVGADAYPSFEGTGKTWSNGENGYFDSIYNAMWFANTLQREGFNALAQVGTKVPQTEPGMNILKGAYRKVCEKAVNCGYLASGSWTNTTQFGNVADLLRNILQVGYYIYSARIADQSQSAREARQAPLVQIGVKESGALHSSNVLIYVNA